MYVIAIYDINQKRVAKVHKICKRYLSWIQNSVFEGEITESQLLELKQAVKKVINKKEEDSFITFEFNRKVEFNRRIVGYEKSPIENVIF